MPSSTTGTAIVGISVARMFCRNTNITRKTSTIASISVLTTSSIDSMMKGVVSTGIDDLACPAGRSVRSWRDACLDRVGRRSALAPVASWIARPAAGLPLS